MAAASPLSADASMSTDARHFGSSAAPMLPYAGFWRRTGGYLIDYVLLIIALSLVSVALLAAKSPSYSAASAFAYGVLFLALCFYPIFLEASPLQATVGKLLVGIKVTDLAGERIGWGRAIGRYFAHVLTGFTFGIGLVMCVFTRRRQTLHDQVAGTLVVRRLFTPAQIVQAGDAPAVPTGTKVLLCVAMVLLGPFGIGVVAAIAIPAYQNYTLRAQVSEALNLADPYKTEVTTAYAQGTPLNAINRDGEPSPSHYVRTLTVESGVIVIVFGPEAGPALRGQRLLLVPGTTPKNDLVWVCGRASAPANLHMVLEDPARYTTVPESALPSLCRGSLP